jgi:hypothetical protein
MKYAHYFDRPITSPVRLTHRQTDRQIGRQAGGQIGGLADRYTEPDNSQADGQTDRQTQTIVRPTDRQNTIDRISFITPCVSFMQPRSHIPHCSTSLTLTLAPNGRESRARPVIFPHSIPLSSSSLTVLFQSNFHPPVCLCSFRHTVLFQSDFVTPV